VGVWHVRIPSRFDGDGMPRGDFVLKRAECAGCRILVAAEDFRCGSSSEHAVWGLVQFGIRAVIAPSFGGIFYSSALNNGLLLVVVPQADVDGVMRDVQVRRPIRCRSTSSDCR